MELRQGMVFSEDVCSSNGLLLIARGTIATQSLVLRLRNFKVGVIVEPLIVEEFAKERAA